jgi:hypothetical protein
MRILLIVLLLSGCASWAEQEDEPVIPESKKVVDIDKRVLEPCKDLAIWPLHQASFESLLNIHKENTILYHECKQKQDTSIKLLKEFSNQ